MENRIKKYIAIMLALVLSFSPCLVSAGDLSDDMAIVAVTDQTNGITDKNISDQTTQENVKEEVNYPY